MSGIDLGSLRVKVGVKLLTGSKNAPLHTAALIGEHLLHVSQGNGIVLICSQMFKFSGQKINLVIEGIDFTILFFNNCLKLGSLDTGEKEVKYVKDLTGYTYSKSSPSQALKNSYPFNNVGLTLGVKVKL